VIPAAFRFRRFSLRVLTLLLGLLFVVLATTYVVVSRANERNALDHARAELDRAARIAQASIQQRIDFLALSAKVVAGDYAFKQAFSDGDGPTMSSALVSFSGRVGAPIITLFDPDGKLIANSEPGMSNENAGPFAYLISEATKQDVAQLSGFSYLKNSLHVLVVVPLYAPYPNIFGWFGLAFPVDRAFAGKIKSVTRVDLTYIATDAPVLADPTTTERIKREGLVLASTLSDASALRTRDAAVAMTQRTNKGDPLETIQLSDDRYVTLYKWQEMLAESPITIMLQRPLTPELEPARELESYIKVTAAAALAAAAVLALIIARGVSEPVRQLAAHTEKIAAGDYDTRITLPRADELGQLAGAMNQMSAGLAERDRVRDLLDKNVSPEVAAQLLRDGAALGGQEREVTILFADLRGFTTLSEKLPAPELLTLLNRYLDRMSNEIEAHGGIIDKFIGDGIMALFGAPVAQGDAADRALAAALAMERALAELNRELAAEGRPPLAIGVGVNTARVVAGNIGSHRRLNYSVVGDGVNIAARLESLTRTAAYCTNIIASAATLAALRAPKKISPRPLGPVQVKGRAEPVEIFAVE
jgi:adenylate cyclase